jgi:hypothetical protein
MTLSGRRNHLTELLDSARKAPYSEVTPTKSDARQGRKGRKVSDDSYGIVAGPQSHNSRFVAKADLLGIAPGAAAGGIPKTD